MSLFSYDINEHYQTRVAYFSMEFAIDQPLKIYSGGLGFLAGSHMRSVYDLKQHTIGVGILWSFGYYDQGRNEDGTLSVQFLRKRYYFLQELDVNVHVTIHGSAVKVKAFLLPCETFGTAPIILLSTDCDENDFLARTITHKLYDNNERTRVAQEIVLGIGGIKVLEALGEKIDVYHLNEGHALPLAFELYRRFGSLEEVKKHLVFTTHTPEKSGNEEHNIYLLHEMGFFAGMPLDEVRTLMGYEHEDQFSLTVGALRSAKITNAVSKIHAIISNEMWAHIDKRCDIISITNAQNRRYWSDKAIMRALEEHEDYELTARKKHLKYLLFSEVANQTGKMFDPEVLTIVWARRFAEYKRPSLLIRDLERFEELITSTDKPIQVIWAGKPYPFDYSAIAIFNHLVQLSSRFKNMAVLIGYELALSKMLKQGCDVWLNTPRITREASGTSGMTASMNGAIHFSINDGWHPEFEMHGKNCFTIPEVDHRLPIEEQDRIDHANMMSILEEEIIPTYYDHPKAWTAIMKNAISSVQTKFDSGRMVHEYYQLMYQYQESK